MKMNNYNFFFFQWPSIPQIVQTHQNMTNHVTNTAKQTTKPIYNFKNMCITQLSCSFKRYGFVNS